MNESTEACRAVDPDALRRARKEMRWTREQLSEKSKVSPRTIARLEERGKAHSSRRHVIERLCSALDLDAEELSGRRPLTRRKPEPEDVRLGFRVSASARNAYTLVARHYGLDEGDLAEVAPLLFALLAEASLRRRRERLERLTQALETFEDEIRLSHLVGMPFVDGDYPRDALWQEEESLIKEDIFGRKIKDDVFKDRVPKDPFMMFLNDMIAKSNDLVGPL